MQQSDPLGRSCETGALGLVHLELKVQRKSEKKELKFNVDPIHLNPVFE